MILKSPDYIQQKKFNVLLKNRHPKHNSDGVIFSYSKISLFDTVKSLLVKKLRFSLPTKKLKYADYVTNFEMFYRSIQNLNVLSNGNLDFVKTKLKDATLKSFCFYNKNVPQNLSDEGLRALEKISKNNNLVVQKADKGKPVVLVDRDVYVKHVENILKDNTKFEKVALETRTFNELGRINEILKSLISPGSVSDKQCKKIKAAGYTIPNKIFDQSRKIR